MAVEYRLVNDNGVQKVIKLDITEPNKKGMSADTTATIVNGDIRTILPLKGDAPISSEEVSIEEWAPTYPGSPTKTWKSSTKSFTDEEIPNLIQRVRNLLKLPNRLQTGGWLTKFDLGGTVQQSEPDTQKRMKELLLVINGAAKELSTKQPGDNVAYLAQVMQDPQEAELLEAIVAEIPDAQEVIDQVSQLSSQMFKCGGKTKKKVKKGANGCVPCKKLMRVGGKLINVLTDCEGNLISKRQVGGWLIPKGQSGLLTDKLVADKYRTVKTGTAEEGAEHYYIADDGSLRRQYAVANNTGGFDWAYENLNQNLNHEGFNKWLSGTINSDTGERVGGVSDFWSNGVNYNNGAVTFNDETTVKGILGEEAYNKGAITGNSVHGVSKSGNTWLGDKAEDLNVTAQDYVQHHGGWQNAMQAEDNILKAKRRASRKLARHQRQNMRDQYRDFDGNISIDLDGEGGNDAVSFTNKRDARQAIRNSRQGYMKEARQARTANQTAILGTLAPQRGAISQNSLYMQTSGGRTTLPTNDVVGGAKLPVNEALGSTAPAQPSTTTKTTTSSPSSNSNTMGTKAPIQPLKNYAVDFDKKTRSAILDMRAAKTAAYKSIANQETNANNVMNAANTLVSHINAPINKMRDEKANLAAVEQKALKIADRLNNPTLNVKISRQYNGGWLTKFQDGGHMDYETKSKISGTTWEQRIDRDNTGALYRYNPGRTSHVVTLQTTGLPIINPTRFVKYGEERYYLTDPKTGRVVKIEGPTIDQRVEEESPVIRSSIIEDHITPEQDVFIFPGGFTKVIPTPVQKEEPKKSKKPVEPEKKVEAPKQDVPTQPNDNTSTSGSKTPGSIRQGNYPIQESIPAPEGYNPSREWVEERDQVNGQVRVTWRNKKTGEISRIKPFKYGGWLTKFN